MDEKDFRENLELKPVTEKDVDQFNELLSYVFQVTEETSKKVVLKAKGHLFAPSAQFWNYRKYLAGSTITN